MSFTSAVVVAAGSGLRLESKIPKPLVKINLKPLIIYSLKALSLHPEIKEIILVTNPQNLRTISGEIRKYKIPKVKKIVFGGKERKDSVKNGLLEISPCADLVLIHDGARPFVGRDSISRAIKAAQELGAAVLGVPVKATIKSVKGQVSCVKVEETLDRRRLWEVQTPQVFKKDLILSAYKKFGDQAATDDAMLVEKLGKKVGVVMGSYSNIKITTPEDLAIAEAISKKWNIR